MIFRRCTSGVSLLLALGVVCGGQEQVVDGSEAPNVKTSEATFLVKPYLQLGHAPPERVGRDLVLLWHAIDVNAAWVVEYQTAVEAAWVLASAPTFAGLLCPALPPTEFFGPS